MDSTPVRSLLLAGALLTSGLTLPGVSLAQTSGSVSWNGWTFNYEVSGNFDGLSLKGVQFQGLPLISKISFLVMRVFYENDACGPFADRLGGYLEPIPWADNATVGRREFTLNGKQWYEIGILDQIGQYEMYQVYYLSQDGILDAHIYSKGLECVVDHVHYPNWRIDFNINDPGNDQIQFKTATDYTTELYEFDANATEALDHGWRVRDSVTGNYVDVLPGFTDFTIPNQTTAPVTGYANNTVFGRLFKDSEDTGWTYGPYTQVPYNNGEPIGNDDIVFWYEGYLPHRADEGSSLWHSTGIRLVVNGNSSPPPPPPPPGGAEAVLWTQLVNVIAEGISLRKTAGCDGCEDAGAVSSQTITSGDGFVEFTASETTTIRVAGLSSGNTNTTSADIDFGIKFWPGGEADVRENDLYRADTTYVSGDVFRVAVQSGVIRYSKNGVVFYTSTVAPTFPLLVDTSLYNLDATIGNAVIFRSAAPPPGAGATRTLGNGTAVSIPDSGSGSPYPSSINVAGMPGAMSNVVVTLNGLSHTYPDDIDIRHVGPSGQNVMLMSDAGGMFDVDNVTLTFDSESSTSLPDSDPISSGTYRPTNYDDNDWFDAPAPVEPYSSSLSMFNQTSPNGSWQRFLNDDAEGDSGFIAGGWALTITTN